jgi:hypothetical protein
VAEVRQANLTGRICYYNMPWNLTTLSFFTPTGIIGALLNGLLSVFLFSLCVTLWNLYALALGLMTRRDERCLVYEVCIGQSLNH